VRSIRVIPPSLRGGLASEAIHSLQNRKNSGLPRRLWRLAMTFACLPFSTHAAPSVVSAGMCADNLVLAVAAREQIMALTKAAADPEISPYADQVDVRKARFLSTERLLFERPAWVITDEYTPFMAKHMYQKLGIKTFDIPPLATFSDVETWQKNLSVALQQSAPKPFAKPQQQPLKQAVAAVFRPGGYSPGKHTNVDYLLQLAGYHNLSSTLGFEGTRTLSLETLVYHHPDVLITDASLTGKYARGFAPLVLQHPVIEARVKTATYIPLAQWFCLSPRSVEAYTKLASR
jgi:iron complex transport system substrate-binding protein